MEYKNLASYFREKYGRRLKKICIDGGFTCPNRDGKCSFGGCIFCGERGAGEHIDADRSADACTSIREQVEAALSHASAEDLFVAYFQNFTNTYADPDTLRQRYDSALIDERIRVLAIGTRPDCIDEEIAELIASYRTRVDLWVELGLQTSSDKTAKIINRGYDSEAFSAAVEILHRWGIPVVAHVMIGLPTEGDEELAATVSFLKGHRIFGVKLHSVYVMEGTVLAEMYRRGEYEPISREDYVRRAAFAIRELGDGVVFHRITGDCPRDLLVAPLWNTEKSAVIEEIRRRLGEM